MQEQNLVVENNVSQPPPMKVVVPSRNKPGYLKFRESLSSKDDSDLCDFLVEHMTHDGLTRDEAINSIKANSSKEHLEDLLFALIVGVDDDKAPPTLRDFKFVFPFKNDIGYLGRKETSTILINSLWSSNLDVRTIINYLKPQIKAINSKYRKLLSAKDKDLLLEALSNKAFGNKALGNNLDIVEWDDVLKIFDGLSIKEIEEGLDISHTSDKNPEFAKRIYTETKMNDFVKSLSFNQLVKCLNDMWSSNELGKEKEATPAPFLMPGQ